MKSKNAIKKFASYYKPHKKLFMIDLMCALLMAILNLFYPTITKNIINDYVPSKNIEAIIIWSGIIGLIFLINAFLKYIIQYWGHIVGVRIQGDMRKEMFMHLQKLPYSYFDSRKTGHIMSGLINDLFDIGELAHHGPEDTFLSVITIIGAFIMLMFVNSYLTLIVFAFLPIMVFLAFKTRKKMQSSFKIMREKTAQINADIETTISGVRVSKAYGMEKYAKGRFNKVNEEFKHSRGMAYKAMAVFYSSLGFASDFLYLIVLVGGALFFYYGQINAGEFAAFILYIAMLINPIRNLITIYESIQSGMTGFSRFCDTMAESTELDYEGAIDIDPKDIKGEIVFENVSFIYKEHEFAEAKDCIQAKPNVKKMESKRERIHYHEDELNQKKDVRKAKEEVEKNLLEESKEKEEQTIKNFVLSREYEEEVLDALNFTIKPGKTTALVGGSGGGKTTICHLIMRFYEIENGIIYLDGKNMKKLTLSSIRKNIGIVAQDVFIFDGTIKENISFGKFDATDEEIIAAAKSAGIHEYIASLEHDYLTQLGERGVNLSGGQRQRISIARAFLKNPKILILDEATSALDTITETNIQASLTKLSEGRTVLVVAHRLSTVQKADQIIVLEKGRVVQTGNHLSLLKEENGVYAKMWNAHTILG